MSAPTTPSNRRARLSSSSYRGELARYRDSTTPEPTNWSTPTPSTRKIEHAAVRLLVEEHLHRAHPSTILARVLKDVSNPNSRHFDRYEDHIVSEGDSLVELLHRCIRREVWDAINTSPDYRPSIQQLSSLGGDTSFYGRAVYLHIIHFPDNITRLYVGQAFNLAARVRNQHSDWRYRRDHPSLHNFAMDRSTDDRYVLLAVVREACEQSDLVLNLLEMWMALWLRTLPQEVLEAWLGPVPRDEAFEIAASEGQVFGLNVAEPLDQGGSDAWTGAFNMLRDSEDDMAREYFWDVRKRPKPVVSKVKDAVLPDVLARRVWVSYLPHALGIMAFGFVLGRWTARFRWRTS